MPCHSRTIGEAMSANHGTAETDRMLKRIDEIDSWFETAKGWGSWMVGMSNERHGLVRQLRDHGIEIEEKWETNAS